MDKQYGPLVVLLWLSLVILPLSGCGYSFSGSGDFIAGIDSVHIAIFKNQTTETGAGNVLTNDLVYEFTRSGIVKLVPKPLAEAYLTGIIRSMRIETVSRRSTSTSLEQRVTFWVTVSLHRSDGTRIWTAHDISENETYEVAEEKVATDQNRRVAVTRLSQRLAERIYFRLTDVF